MDFGEWLPVAVATVAVGIWLLAPYFAWRESNSKPLEAFVARTSFQCTPGELVPPAWRPPDLALSVVVTAYNEERLLPQMLEETLSYLEARAVGSAIGFTYEVIVVDDGSTDSTYSAALGARRRGPPGGRGELRVLQLASHRGKGFALRLGVLAARGKLLLTADADGSTSVRDLERLEYALALQGEGGAQVAFGSRQHLKAEVLARRSLPANALAVTFQALVHSLIGGPLHDMQCGFKLFRADIGKHLFASLHLHRQAFDVELVLLTRMLGQKVAEVPVTWVEMPGSQPDLLARLGMLREVVLLRLLYAVGAWRPLSTA